VSAADGDGASLVATMIEELRELHGGLDLNAPDMPTAGAGDLAPPGGRFPVGYRDGQPVPRKRVGPPVARGVPQPVAACEIKRMYVVPAARGQRVARALLPALEAGARCLGYRVARLDTAPRQPHARGLYESEGYVPIGNFNGNPVATFFGETRLSG
jgi:GNAT superfamily N-acetyltransferase